MKNFGDYILTIVRLCAVNMLFWGGLLIVLFIIVGLLIGVAQVILGGTATILIKYTALILIASIIYGTFNFATSDPDDEEWKAPHECT